MPKRPVLLLFLLFISLLLSSCKKGEDDPTISLRSRKNRVVGEWRMTSGKASYTHSTYNESYTFDGTNVKVNVTSVTPVVYTGKYSLKISFEKNGSFAVSEDLAGSKFTANGSWNFSTGIGEEKKKENLIFNVENVEVGYTISGNLFNRQSAQFTYHIKELRNKKIVIHSSGKLYTNASGQYATLSTEYILEPQN